MVIARDPMKYCANCREPLSDILWGSAYGSCCSEKCAAALALGNQPSTTLLPTGDDLIALAEAWKDAAVDASDFALIDGVSATALEHNTQAAFAAAVERVKERLGELCIERIELRERAETAEAALTRQSQDLAAMRTCITAVQAVLEKKEYYNDRRDYDVAQALEDSGFPPAYLRHPASTTKQGG